MSAVFPNELLDRIIDHLHNDDKTLSACALVCLSWIPAVRYHRFGHVLLGPPGSIAAFHALLQTYPDVASYVSHIDILINWSHDQNTAALCAVLSSTPNLRALSLKQMVLGSDETHDIFSALPKCLEFVELRHIYLPTGTVGDLIFLWSRLPRLRSFVLIGDTQIHGPEIPEEYMRGHTRLLRATEIQLLWQVPHFDVIADWLCSQNVPAQLRACSLTVARREYVAPIARLLHEVGPALEKLAIDLNSGAAAGGLDVLYACDLAQCTNLKELHFSGIILDERPDVNIILCMSQILSHIHAPGIRTLVVSIWGSNSGNIPQLGSVAAAISHNCAFRDLERVLVRLGDVLGAPISEGVYASIRDTLKLFEERGLLTIEGLGAFGPAQWID